MKKAWVASITVLFTVSVLVFSSQAAYAGQTPEFALLCYQAAPVANIDPGPVPFVDQFQDKMVDPDVDQRYCVEALKHSDTAPNSPIYFIEFEDESVSAINDLLLNPNGITITDQFLGTYTANLDHFELLLPATVTGGLVAGGPNDQDYSGYTPFLDLATSNLFPLLQVPPLMVTDQFGTHMITQLDFIFAFQATAMINQQGTLVGQDLDCYQFTEDPEIMVTAPQSTWVTQLTPNGQIVTNLGNADVLCVKADKKEPTTPPPTTPKVGGEFLPIETTSLLLAAASNPASWLTSLTIAALGIGVYVFSRNPNNMRNIKVILRDYLDRL